MSTRCYITKKYPNDSYAFIYCHSSGDPTYTGAILAEHWLDPDDVENLIQLGSISSIGHSIADCTLTDQNNEADSEPTLHPDFQSILDDLSDDIFIEWMYVFDRGHWMVMEHLYDKDEPGARGARWSEPGPINNPDPTGT